MTDSPRSAASVAYDALKLGEQNARDIESHEDLCAVRYGNIDAAIARIEGFLKWAGVTGFSIIIALLGYLAASQWSATNAASQRSAYRIETLETQLNQAQTAPHPR